MYKNSQRSLYFRGSLAYFKDFVYADNNGAPLFAFNSVMQDSMVLGWSRNAEVEFLFEEDHRQDSFNRVVPGLLNIYDGPLITDNLLVAGLPSVLTRWKTTAQIITPALIRTIGAHQRFFGQARSTFACFVVFFFHFFFVFFFFPLLIFFVGGYSSPPTSQQSSDCFQSTPVFECRKRTLCTNELTVRLRMTSLCHQPGTFGSAWAHLIRP